MSQIAYLGPELTFTEQAARSLVDLQQHELVSMGTIAAALAAVRSGDVEAAVVPVENSVEGSVPPTLDALATGVPLIAVAETVLPVRFAVLVRPGTAPADVRTVTSHPHALAQVRQWLATHLPQAVELVTTSTAAAAHDVQGGKADAAITAPIAAEKFDLDIIATDIVDVADAVTRFLLISRPGSVPVPTGNDRTSLVIVADDKTGVLADILVELAMRGINLTRIESRPTKTQLGKYRFFLDLSGHVTEKRMGEALAALRRRCADIRFLGSYPRADGLPVTQDSALLEEDFIAAQEWLAAIRNDSF